MTTVCFYSFDKESVTYTRYHFSSLPANVIFSRNKERFPEHCCLYKISGTILNESYFIVQLSVVN